MNSLEGLNALVTGSSRGIGKRIAIELAKQGANVVVSYRKNKEKALETVSEIKGLGRKSIAIRADVGEYEEIVNLSEEALRVFGKIDILVNNAGYSSHYDFFEIPKEEWDRTIRVNLSAAFFLSQKLAKKMIENGFGRIINIGSIRARTGSPHGPHYASAKAGLHGLTKSLALILGPYGITVNTVIPGYILTDMTKETVKQEGEKIKESIPVKKIGVPGDIARVVAFLASPDSYYINGALIDVNGGLYFPP